MEKDSLVSPSKFMDGLTADCKEAVLEALSSNISARSFMKFLVFCQFILDPALQAQSLNPCDFMQDMTQAASESSLETVTAKITALLRVFYTVVLSLGDSISTLRGGPITVDYLVEVRKEM